MADGEVVVEIRAASVQFDQSLSRGRRQLDLFDNAARPATRSAEQFNRSTTQAAQGARRLNQEIRRGAPGLDRYQASLKQASDSAALLTGPLGGIASRINILSRITSPAAAGMLGLSVAIGTVTAAFTSAVNEAEKFERLGFRTQAVLKATGFAAGLTARDIRNLSEEIALSTLASVEGVETAAAQLLTFKSVQNDVFKDALRLSQDLAEVGFGSISSSAVQLGKALEDPIKGLSALRRVGVSFSESQKEQIKTLFESGKVVEAQRIILKALQEQVGGAGAAAAGGLSGAYDTLGQRVSEFGQGLATQTGALSAWTNLINNMAGAVHTLNEALFDTPEERLQDLLEQRAQLQDPASLRSVLTGIAAAGPGPLGMIGRAAFGGRLKAVNDEIAALQNKMLAEKEDAATAKINSELNRRRVAEEARLAKQRESAAKEVERLEKARKTAIRTLKEEIVTSQQVLPLLENEKLSRREVAREQEKLALLSKLHLDAQSKEGQQIVQLVEQKQKLAQAIEHETSLRKIAATSQQQIQGIEIEIQANQMLAQSIGGTEKQIREAQIAAEKYRMEQEAISQIILESGQITEEQRVAISEAADGYAIAATRLAEVTAAQEKARQATEDFQNTLSEGLTDAIFSARSLEDVFKSMILQIARAIVQAQLLKAIQSSGIGGAVGGTIAAAVFHKGGVVGTPSASRSVSPNTFIAAPRFHNGLRPDEFPAILQRGEEVVPRNEVSARRATSQVTNYNVTVQTPDADSFRSSQRQIARKIRRSTART